MTATQQTPIDFDLEFNRIVADLESAAASGPVAEEPLLWAAVAPAWSPETAVACDFPVPESAAAAYLEQLHHDGILEKSVASPALGGNFYTMDRVTRSGILDTAVGSGQIAPEHIRNIAKHIGDRLIKLSGVLPAGLKAWAVAAADLAGSADVADILSRRFNSFLDDARVADARSLLDAVRSLADVLPSVVQGIADEASRRIALLIQIREDEARLTNYVTRVAAERAVVELLEGTNERWALHLLGQGGVGKTTLVRSICARLIPARGGSVARIDFDYLNPEFPDKAPGLLFGYLADALRLNVRGIRGASRFETYRQQMLSAHEALASNLRDGTAASEYPTQSLVGTFADALRELPRPLLLVFDTCEELARRRIGREPPRSLMRTFDLLEQLQALTPDIRVLFAGRRPIASGGTDWSINVDLPRRPYLDLVEIDGFNRDEALSLLLGADVPENVADQVLARAPTAPSHQIAARFGYYTTHVETARYNPVDLAIFASWARDDPSNVLSEFGKEWFDNYVEQRIVGHLRDEGLRAALPAIALLGSFDKPTLQATIGQDATETLWDELLAQEWIEREPVSEYVHVAQSLLPRLIAWVERNARPSLKALRARALDYLETATVEKPLRRLALSDFEHVIIFGADEPQRVLQWWRKVEQRLLMESAWNWGFQLVERLLGGDRDSVVTVLRSGTLYAPALATFGAAALRIAPQSAKSAWAELRVIVEQQASEDDPLWNRAICGQLAAELQCGSAIRRSNVADETEEALTQFARLISRATSQSLTDEDVASIIAGLEFVTELSETRGCVARLLIQTAGRFVNGIAFPACRTIKAYACALLGRLCAVERAWDTAEAWFSEAKALLEKELPRERAWLVWISPEDVRCRVALDQARAYEGSPLTPEEIVARAFVDAPMNRDVDGACSRTTRLQLRRRYLPPGTLLDEAGAWRTANSLDQVRSIVTRAQRDSVAAGEVAAEILAEAGRGDEALQALDHERFASESDTASGIQSEAIERSRLRIALRMRLTTELDRSQGSRAPPDGDLTLDWALQGLTGASQEPRRRHLDWSTGETMDPVRLHGYWRSLQADSVSDYEFLLAEGPKLFGSLPGPNLEDFADLSCLLDRLEFARLASVNSHQRQSENDLSAILDLSSTARLRRALPEQEAIWQMRREVLGGTRVPQKFWLNDELLRWLGVNRAAALCWDEGQMLVLRDPARGLPLLDCAERLYAYGEDRVGALLASTLAGLTEIRLEAARVNVRRSERLAMHYHAVRDNLGFPPLSILADSKIADPLADFDISRFWAPWLGRIAAFLRFVTDPWPVPPHAERLHMRSPSLTHAGVVDDFWATLVMRFAETSSGDPRLSPELDWIRWHQPRNRPSSVAAHLGSPSEAMRPLIAIAKVAKPRCYSVEAYGRNRETALRVGQIELQPEGSYRDLALAGLESLHELGGWWSEEVRERLDEELLYVGLDREGGEPCWEAVITSAAQRAPLGSSDALPIVRLLTSPRRAGRVATEGRVLVIGAKRALRREINGLWGRTTFDAMQDGRLKIRDFQSIGPDVPGILHILGEPVRVLGGARLRLGSEWSGSEKASSSKRGSLFAPTDLHRLQALPRACVIQMPTDSDVSSNHLRVGLDRVNADLLRAFATEICAAGVPVVITLPSLPDWLVTRSLEIIVRGAERSWKLSDNVPIAAAACDARREICRCLSRGEGDGWEAGYDASVYL